MIHHQRAEKGRVLTEFLKEGDVRLDPPGLPFPVATLFEDFED